MRPDRSLLQGFRPYTVAFHNQTLLAQHAVSVAVRPAFHPEIQRWRFSWTACPSGSDGKLFS